MWRNTITLSIVAAVAGASLAQQPAAEPVKPADDQPKFRDQAIQKAEEATLRAEKAAIAQQNRALAEQRRVLEQQARTLRRTTAAPRLWAAPRATRKEKVAYLGVATMEVSPELAAQLKLSPGMGLVVFTVLPDSPAERAGVKQYDLITKFDDQFLTNPEQLRVLVRMKKQSDDVKLSVIRQGAPTTVDVELGQQEVEVEVGGELGAALGVDDVHQGLINLQPAAGGNDVNFTFNSAAADAFVVGGGGGVAVANVAGRNEIVWADGEHTLNLELQDGKAARLTARARGGKEIFKGPVETDEQRAALPAEIAGKLKRAEAGGPLRFGAAAPARGKAAAARARVLTSTEQDRLLVARVENGKAVHAFAFSQVDGKTLFDGPVATDEQRKGLPPEVAKQLEVLEANPDAASEFGTPSKL